MFSGWCSPEAGSHPGWTLPPLPADQWPMEWRHRNNCIFKNANVLLINKNDFIGRSWKTGSLFRCWSPPFGLSSAWERLCSRRRGRAGSQTWDCRMHFWRAVNPFPDQEKRRNDSRIKCFDDDTTFLWAAAVQNCEDNLVLNCFHSSYCKISPPPLTQKLTKICTQLGPGENEF